MEPADQVAALLVGMFGYRAGVHHADIGLLLRPDPHIAPFGEFACEGRGFGKVELAPEGVKTDAAFHDDCFSVVPFRKLTGDKGMKKCPIRKRPHAP